MLEIFKTQETNSKLSNLDYIEKGCWINLVAPSEAELEMVIKNLGLEQDMLRDPLDDEE